MSSVGQSDSAVIDRVCIRAASNEAVAVRQKVERALRGATLRPARLPSFVILIVRKLRDVTPTSRLSGYNRTQILEWERSLNAELDRLASEAVRVAGSPVPMSAEAVLFADRAEMLACFALDWLRGAVGSNWWWRTLLRGNDPATAVAREWTSSPEFVPLALEHMAERSHAVAFARHISEELAATLLSRLLSVFAVPVGTKSEPGQSDASALDWASSAGNKIIDPMASNRGPWSSIVPEADAAELTPTKRIFVAQALMLRRAPATARSIAFQTKLLDWRLSTATVTSPGQLPTDGTSPEQRQHCTVPPPQMAEGDSHLALGGIAPALTNAVGQAIAALGREASKAGELRISHKASDANPPRTSITDYAISPERAQQTSPSPFRISTSPENLAQIQSPPTAHLLHGDITDVEVTEATQAVTELTARVLTIGAEQRVQSALAGVFFLINVALAMGLYSDFTSPQGRNLALDIWDFLALLARQFVQEEIYADGLNLVLATLAGRNSTQSPGENFDPPQNWHLPNRWLDAFPEFFEWKEVVRDCRIQVEHPAGFLLKDEAPHGNDNAGSLQRWVKWVGDYVRARLVRALGRDDAAEFLCHVPGKVEIRSLYVDVYYSLQTYPTGIRLAGLDRDPGWVPAAGHYVAYHFD